MAAPHHKYFLTRNADGSARVRMKFRSEEAAMIEEACGDMRPIDWLHQTINEAAARKVRRDRQRQHIAPPKEQA